MMKMLPLLLVTFMGIAAQAVPPMGVENSAFEDICNGVPTGWRFIGGKNMSAARGPGLNGSGAVVWEATGKTSEQCGCVRDISFEVGCTYRISCAVRSKDFTAGAAGAAICIEWRGRDGRHIGGGYVNHFRARNSDWVRLEGVTPPVPSEAAAVSVQIYVVKGLQGKVVFDDVRVDPLVLPAVTFVTSSAYRNEATGGCVRIVAEVNRPKDADWEDLETVFRWQDAEGRWQERPARDLDEHGVAMDLTVASLSHGKTSIRCVMRRVSTNAEVGSAEMCFVRDSKRPRRNVVIDDAGRCFVGGKPFFPIGLFAGDMSPETMKIYCRGPFNAVMPYRAPTPDELDVYAQHGIMVAYSLKDVKLSASWIKELGIATHEALAAYLRRRIDAVKDHPALLAWYVNDESPATEIPERTDILRLFHEQDAHHPTWAVMDRTYDLRGFLPTADIIGFDPYPVPKHPVASVTDFVREARKKLMNSRPMWNVPQGFNWKWYRTDDDTARMPTEAEVRNMCWQHIAGGANGLFLYSFHSLRLDVAKADFDRNFAMLCRVAGEVRDHIPVMTGEETKVEFDGDSVTGRAWVTETGCAVLVVNAALSEKVCTVSTEAGRDEVRLRPLEVRWIEQDRRREGRVRCLSVADYRDRMMGAWLGKSIGVAYGWPTEFKAKGTLIRDEDMPVWTTNAINETFAQDDLYVQLGFLRTLAERGLKVSAREAGLDFANTRYRVWCGNFNGRNNIRRGIAAPYSSHPAFHPSTDDLDYEIESDFTGIIAPGMPQVAVQLGNVFGRLMNYADGVYAGQFIGAMYAEAFFESNRCAIVESALRSIPSASEYAEMVRGVLADWRRDSHDWKQAWRNAVDAWFNEKRAGRVSFPAVGCKVNGAMVLIGFLFGDGDLERTMKIATQCGFDSDCNPSTACGLLGALKGAKAIPERYVVGLSQTNSWEYVGYTFPQLIDACVMIVRKMAVAQGGRVSRDEKGEEMLCLPMRPARPDVLQSASAPESATNIGLTPREMEQIRYLPDYKSGVLSMPKEQAHVRSIDVGGELRMRIDRNFDRLEETKYRPENVFLTMEQSRGWPGDTEGRTILALVLDALRTGRMPKHLDAILRRMPSQLNERGYFGPVWKDTVNEQQVSGMGWVLRGLCAYYRWKRDPQTLESVRRIADNLFLPAAADFAAYPIDPAMRVRDVGGASGNTVNKVGRWELSTDVGCFMIGIDGLIDARMTLEDAKYDPLIEKAIARYLEIDQVAIRAQAHATLTGIRALLRYGVRYLAEAEERFRRYRENCMTETYANANWFARFDTFTEPCAIIDSYMVSLQLWTLTGKFEYLELADRIYWNGICRAQRRNGGFGLESCPMASSPDLKVREPEAHWCCTMRGAEGLFTAAEYIVRVQGNVLTFAQYHPATVEVETAAGTVRLREDTDYPASGAVRVTILAAPDKELSLRFFAPSYLATSEAVKDGFVERRGVFRPGDVVEVPFTLGEGVLSAQCAANAEKGLVRHFRGPLLLNVTNHAQTVWHRLSDGLWEKGSGGCRVLGVK